jgi:FMN reductase
VNIGVLIGNPKPNSLTFGVAVAVAEALTRPGSSNEHTMVDLADVARELFDPDSVTVPTLLEQGASSDLIIVASPTYKATYTGLLKSFLDRYGKISSPRRSQSPL